MHGNLLGNNDSINSWRNPLSGIIFQSVFLTCMHNWSSWSNRSERNVLSLINLRSIIELNKTNNCFPSSMKCFRQEKITCASLTASYCLLAVFEQFCDSVPFFPRFSFHVEAHKWADKWESCLYFLQRLFQFGKCIVQWFHLHSYQLH